MNKKVVITTVLFFIAVIGAIMILTKKNGADTKPSENNSTDLVFYYGDTCPHCKIVEEFFIQSKAEEKIKFDKKEVYNNKKNATDYGVTAQKCNLKEEERGVPLFYDGQECLVGDQPIIDYFKQKLNIQ